MLSSVVRRAINTITLIKRTLSDSTYYLPNVRLKFQVVRPRGKVLDSTEPVVGRVHISGQKSRNNFVAILG